MISIQKNLLEMLWLRDMTIADLAKSSGISTQHIYRIFNIPTALSVPTLKKFAKALGCTPGWLTRE